MADLLFYTFAFLTLACAALVVINKDAVNAAMFLIVSLVGVAGLFVLLDAALLAFVLLLVYAGAVVTLFLFIVMLLDTTPGALQPFKKTTLVASTLGGALLVVGVGQSAVTLHATHAPLPSHRCRCTSPSPILSAISSASVPAVAVWERSSV